jgi:paraquat-inducible protein B
MAATTTSLKLGLFTLAGIVAAVIAALVLGVRSLHVDTVAYHTYFDEAVTGLDVGAQVRFRGVPVGTVSQVTIAPDGRHVDVATAIRVEDVPRLVWSSEHDTGLRTQLETQGLTGVKLVNIDFFDPTANPPPVLSFAASGRYIPAKRSLLGGLEQNLDRTADRLPQIADAVIATLAHLEKIFATYDEAHLPAQISSALSDVRVTAADLDRVARSVDRAHLPDKTSATLAHLDSAVASVATILERVDGDAGLIASTQRATEAVSRLGQTTSGATADLDRTLRDLGDAARAVRELVGALERDPDMFLKGASKAKAGSR